jgi:hypothetical protein
MLASLLGGPKHPSRVCFVAACSPQTFSNLALKHKDANNSLVTPPTIMVLTLSRGQQLATCIVLAIAIASYMFASPTQLLVRVRDGVTTPDPPMRSGPAIPVSWTWSPAGKARSDGKRECTTASIPELAKEYSAALKRSCPQVAGNGQLCRMLKVFCCVSHTRYLDDRFVR